MLICPIRTFCILRSLKIVKYVQLMLTGGRHIHHWTHKAKMVGLFVLFTCSTEPLVAFLRNLGDHSATHNATISKLARALLLLT